MNFKWFTSRTVRLASDMCKHVRKLLNAQRDILSPQAVSAVESANAELSNAIKENAPEPELKKRMDQLETAANKWLKPYPNAGIRENVEVLLVALAVAMGIRTFFLQPFKIPTGSMQPTLFGLVPEPYSGNQLDLKVPGPVERFFEYWTRGYSYYDIVAPEDGELQAVRKPTRLLLFNLKQDYEFNNKSYTVWFPSDDLFQRAGYHIGYDSVMGSPQFKAGDPIVRLKVVAGDHLFVDRVSYNFRHPTRGEIIVFETSGIPGMSPNQWGQFYIKRLVALGDEKVQIGNDRHLIIDGRRLDNTTPHFENVYSFDPAVPPHESRYSGHLNEVVAEQYHMYPGIAPNFPDQNTVFQVSPGHYMVMGDNTCNSSDSRVWGDFTRTNVIGKYFLVYWPFSPRFGWNVK
jgi:signal peptidase I